MGALYKGLAAASVLALLGFAWLASNNSFAFLSFGQIFYPLFIGILITALIVLITEYYTSKKFRPVRSIAQVIGDGPRHEHHHRPFGRNGINGAAGSS